jgi:hypothetical protein
MQDITKNRPPLSRWHPEYAPEFAAYLEAALATVDTAARL